MIITHVEWCCERKGQGALTKKNNEYCNLD